MSRARHEASAESFAAVAVIALLPSYSLSTLEGLADGKNAAECAAPCVGGGGHGGADPSAPPSGSVGSKPGSGAAPSAWAKTFESAGSAWVFAMALDPSGAAAIIGGHTAPLDLGLGPLDGAPNRSSAFVARLAADGTPIFSRRWGAGPGDEQSRVSPRAMATDPAGNIYVTGSWTGAIDFGDAVRTSPPPVDGDHLFLARVDAKTGDTVWVQLFDAVASGARSQLNALALDPNGNIVLAGYVLGGAVSFGGKSGSVQYGGQMDGIVIRARSSDGGVDAVSVFGGSDGDMLYDVAVSGDGRMAIAGTSWSPSIDFGGKSFTNSGSNADAFVVLMHDTDTLAPSWVGSFGGATTYDSTQAVTFAPGGDLVAAGSFGGPFDAGGAVHTSFGGADVFVARLDGATGAVRWVDSFGGPDEDGVVDVSVDSGGNALVAGTFYSSITVGGASYRALPYDAQSNLTAPGGLLVKLDAVGQYRATTSFGDGESPVTGAAFGEDGAAVVAGWFRGDVRVAGAQKTASPGASDAFIAKLPLSPTM
jgi:hypothetical protein